MPHASHWQAMKSILRYLKHTMDYGLTIIADSTPTLVAFFDANWAGYPDDHKSTGGFCIFLGKNLISWSFKKQPTIALLLDQALMPNIRL